MSANDILYYVFLVVWLVIPIALFALYSRRGRLAGVLVYAYLVGFFMNHWMGALVHTSPQSTASMFWDSDDTVSGFRLSTLGLLAFAVGVLLAGTAARLVPAARVAGASLNPNGELPPFFVQTLFIIGLASWALSFTAVSSLPSASSVLSAGRHCVLLAVCLLCWSAWQQKKNASFRWWLAAAFALPVVTVMTQGFIGYGIMMLATVLVFTAMFFRPRWILLVGLFVGIYAGMSFWVAYLNHRQEVRSAVWGDAEYQKRISSLINVVRAIEPFDLSNPDHLTAIDTRLNQNWLVGATLRTTPDLVPYEDGETIYSAILAIIPRAIWADKPVTAGGGSYVSKHTLIAFDENTSVGMGQVLEFYINFGVPGVLLGFLALGLILRRLDLRLTRALEERDFHNVQFYFLTGMGALQPGGSLAEIVASCGGGAVLAIVASRFVRRRTAGRKSGALATARPARVARPAGPVLVDLAVMSGTWKVSGLTPAGPLPSRTNGAGVLAGRHLHAPAGRGLT